MISMVTCNEPIAGLRNGPISSLNRIAMFVFSTFVVSRNPLIADLAKSLIDKIIQHIDISASNFYGSFINAVIHLFESSLICTKASCSYGIKILFESLKTHFFKCSRTDIENTLNVLLQFLRDTTEMSTLSMETNDLLHFFNLNFRILDETYIPTTLPNGIDLRGKILSSASPQFSRRSNLATFNLTLNSIEPTKVFICLQRPTCIDKVILMMLKVNFGTTTIRGVLYGRSISNQVTSVCKRDTQEWQPLYDVIISPDATNKYLHGNQTSTSKRKIMVYEELMLHIQALPSIPKAYFEHFYPLDTNFNVEVKVMLGIYGNNIAVYQDHKAGVYGNNLKKLQSLLEGRSKDLAKTKNNIVTTRMFIKSAIRGMTKHIVSHPGRYTQMLQYTKLRDKT